MSTAVDLCTYAQLKWSQWFNTRSQVCFSNSVPPEQGPNSQLSTNPSLENIYCVSWLCRFMYQTINMVEEFSHSVLFQKLLHLKNSQFGVFLDPVGCCYIMNCEWQVTVPLRVTVVFYSSCDKCGIDGSLVKVNSIKLHSMVSESYTNTTLTFWGLDLQCSLLGYFVF